MSTEAKPGDSPTTEELRETLMAAVEVARAGQKEKPPVEPPARLKQLLAFRKFPERALGQVREVVEADEEFRTRVVEALEESEVSRVGWLWLARPEGWEQERLALSEEAEREAELATEAQRLVDLEQGLHRAEAAQKKAERQRDKADRERDQAKSEAIQARADAHHAEEAAGELESQRDQAHAKLEAAEKNLERVQRREARTEAKLKNARTQIDRLNKELRDSRQQHDEEAGSLKQRLATAEERLAMAQDAGFELPLEDEPVFVPPPPPTHRTPAPLPPGLLKDTVDAAEHLFRTVPELVVLIDGYNVAFKSWTDLPVREQRVRLMQKLGELSSRYSGAEFVVVYDGTATDYDYIPTTARSLGVTERFSKPGVEADDVIIDLCDEYPLNRHIVVVSEDNRVRSGARDRGANLVHPRKLLEIMGLEVDDPQGWAGFEDR